MAFIDNNIIDQIKEVCYTCQQAKQSKHVSQIAVAHKIIRSIFNA